MLNDVWKKVWEGVRKDCGIVFWKGFGNVSRRLPETFRKAYSLVFEKKFGKVPAGSVKVGFGMDLKEFVDRVWKRYPERFGLGIDMGFVQRFGKMLQISLKLGFGMDLEMFLKVHGKDSNESLENICEEVFESV